ncbi:MAG: nucleotide sugar dehydrogenase [Candidatus Eremiobacterota bacterium]
MAEVLPEKLVVVGLGYVGLPLAAAFGGVLPTVGFDISAQRVGELSEGRDVNNDVPSAKLKSPHLSFTTDPECIRGADFVIVAVPTPVDDAHRPDLSALLSATRTVGRHLSPGAIVVYESTVYPGCTEEDCMPVLEAESGLKAGKDFFLGYSPERINPGDHEHSLENIVKIVSAQDEKSLEKVTRTYGAVVRAGVYPAPNIRTAEAAKVIENVQRDLNIALMNELAMIFHRMGLDTREVLKAAGTKWNFLSFEPGLVGGHCIPVDPYYLTHKAEVIGYHPEMILAGRRINDGMGAYVASQTVKQLIAAGFSVRDSRVLVMGCTFKPDVRDLRNSKVFDLIRELSSYQVSVHVHDPVVGAEDLRRKGLQAVEDPFSAHGTFHAVILAVPHGPFRTRGAEEFAALVKGPPAGVVMDLKGALTQDHVNSGVRYWRL